MRTRAVPRCEPLEDRSLLSVTFQFDYSLDTNSFFDTPAKKDLLELAGRLLTSRLGDSLAPINPGGFDEWSATFSHPGTGADVVLPNLAIPTDTLLVYVGGRPLPGTELAESGPAGWSASGSADWLDRVQGRGQPGALGPRDGRTDFAPAVGTVSFDTGTNWYFNSSPAGLPPTRIDFLSVAVHELGHVLGFGTADSWQNLATAGGSFTGTASVAGHGGAVPLHADLAHWAEGVESGGAVAAMTPELGPGEVQRFTPLDFAGLDDLGWDVLPAVGFNVSPTSGLTTTKLGGTASFTVNLTSTPTAEVTVTLRSSDADAATLSATTLTFTPGNALVPQRVTVTGVNDGVSQSVAYAVVLEPAASADPVYDGRDPDDVSLTNLYIPPPPPPPPPLTPDTSSSAVDVTAFVQIHRVKLQRRGRKNRLTIRLIHNGDRALFGPISVVLVGLKRNVRLLRPTASTQVFGRAGSPYVDAAGGILAPGGFVTLVLEFSNPTGQGLRFGVLIVAGPGPR